MESLSSSFESINSCVNNDYTVIDLPSNDIKIGSSAARNMRNTPATSLSSLSNISTCSSNTFCPTSSSKQLLQQRRASFTYGVSMYVEDEVLDRRQCITPNFRLENQVNNTNLPRDHQQKYKPVRSRSPSPPLSANISCTPNHPTKLYPNCDATVWLRSCEKEIIEPIHGTLTGCIPKWLNGSLLRNGPGSLKVGDMEFNHLFDSSALLHRFAICDGVVTYQCRFLQTDTYKRNKAANRIVVTEFGTSSVPDPCHTIFQRISAIFKPGEMSDNAMISVYPFGDEYFAFTEYPVIHKIDIDTLSTEKKVNVTEFVGVMSHTSHPHVTANGTVYNLGMTITKTGPCYNIICFPNGNAMFEDAHIVATLPSRWKFYPSYMHTFGITDNYFVIVEQPLSISVPEMIKSQLASRPMCSNFKWFADQNTCIYLVSRHTGDLKYTFETEALFYLHLINTYEWDDHVVVDICCYKNPSMLDCMYVEAMRNIQSNPDYATMFRGKPMRFVLPTVQVKRSNILVRSFTLANVFSKLQSAPFKLTRSISEHVSVKYASVGDLNNNNNDFGGGGGGVNLVKLPSTKAEAYRMENSENIFCKPELLCDLGCETPRIFYEAYCGKKYRYFYAISADVDAENPGTLIKVDVDTKTTRTWCENNCYPSEPIFVPSPYAEEEDDGIILAAMVWDSMNENKVGLLVLCAKSFIELGRCEFDTPGPVPKCLHGWFAAK